MGDLKLTTVEEMEAATARLLETGAKVGADAWQLRVKNQTPHCKFGEQGVCCRICAMGPENPPEALLWARRHSHTQTPARPEERRPADEGPVFRSLLSFPHSALHPERD